MNEYSILLSHSQFNDALHQMGYSTSYLPSSELKDDAYTTFIDRFIEVNDVKGFNHSKVDWFIAKEYMDNTIARINSGEFNGVNAQSFTLTSRLDSIAIKPQGPVVKLIRVAKGDEKEKALIGDAILAAFSALIIHQEWNLTSIGLEMLTIESLHNPIIIENNKELLLNLQPGSCELTVGSERIEVLNLLEEVFESLCV
ncbi:hypothetical protein N9760_04000 [Schleiferiaceae bacterium]|nr:hypothetical protein [Schleiferiaceae bacterium]